jgi:tetratricopeptide (TPR) repeat protein
VLFELGQAEFYVGNYYFERGNLEAAGPPYQNYFEVAQALYDSDPNDRQWLLELSYASMNLMALHIRSDHAIDQNVLDETEANVRLAERTLAAWPDSSEVLSHYSNVMAWAADAQLMTCNLAKAGRYRQITVDQALQASNGNRSNKWLRQRLAYRQTGLAGVLSAQGNLAEAEEYQLASLELLTGLLAADPSNEQLATDVAMSKLLLAEIMRDTGRVETALDLMQQAEPDLRPTPSLEQASKNNLLGYADYLFDRARLFWLMDDREEALGVLGRLREIVLLRGRGIDQEPEYRSRVAHLRYLWWEIEGEDPADEFPALQLEEHPDWSGLQSCSDAVLGAKLAIISGDHDRAQRYADYLAAHGYRNPTYLNFCRRNQLCTY